MFTVEDIKELRIKTGFGTKECSKALTLAKGDMEKATEILTGKKSNKTDEENNNVITKKVEINQPTQEHIEKSHIPQSITCPKCHTDKVHWIPIEQTPFSKTFYIWLILSVLGVSFSPIITIIMFILWIVTLLVRFGERRYAKKFNEYQCDMCGHKFDIPKQ